MTEHKRHYMLKQKAKECLLNNFEEYEISFEYKIIIDDRKYIIDAVAINNGGKVAIECGCLNTKNRIEILSTVFDKVIHFPYLDCNLIIKKEIKKYIQKSRLIGVCLPKSFIEKIIIIAEKEQIPKCEVIRTAISKYIKNYEVKKWH